MSACRVAYPESGYGLDPSPNRIMDIPTKTPEPPSLPRWFNSLHFKLALVNLTVVLVSL